MKSENLSPRENLRIVTQVCDTLDKMHARGWIHVDVKTDNICVQRTRRGVQAKLIDFGLAVRESYTYDFESQTECWHVAPEVMHNEPVTMAADFFSVGRLLQKIDANICDLNAPIRMWIREAVSAEPTRRLDLYVVSELLTRMLYSTV
ncbi:hypothetical protein OTU49_002285 [Cherax quadricarinatus]|uniref:Protein kinase domain-containing protein n=1 Tax=Cherax quadricarinatus TaxID=27406 RepID=A0AAW0XQM8_CHEQU